MQSMKRMHLGPEWSLESWCCNNKFIAWHLMEQDWKEFLIFFWLCKNWNFAYYCIYVYSVASMILCMPGAWAVKLTRSLTLDVSIPLSPGVFFLKLSILALIFSLFFKTPQFYIKVSVSNIHKFTNLILLQTQEILSSEMLCTWKHILFLKCFWSYPSSEIVLNVGGGTTGPHPPKLDVLRNLITDLGLIFSE
jgi:hypothetical protein